MMRKHFKTIMVFGLITLLLSSTIAPSTSGINNNSKTSSLKIGNVLYVGGSGPGNYTIIQDAIDNATDGDTVFVYNGNYTDRVHIVRKSINLIGENKENTILYTDSIHHYFFGVWESNNVIIKNFKLQVPNCFGIIITDSTNVIFSDNLVYADRYAVFICGNLITFDTTNITIRNNTIDGASLNCIAAWGVDDILIENNTIKHSPRGISSNNKNTKIKNNIITNCEYGINLWDDENAQISGNSVSENEWGIFLYNNSKHCEIHHNSIFNNSLVGIYLNKVQSLKLSQNNIYNNKYNAFFATNIFKFLIDLLTSFGIVWCDNYWGGAYEIYRIPGCLNVFGPMLNRLFGINIGYPLIPIIAEFDTSPAQQPIII